MDLRIPPLNIKILLESNPLKSRFLVRRIPKFSRRNSKPKRRLGENRDDTHQIRLQYTWYRLVFLESPLGFVVPSGEFLDRLSAMTFGFTKALSARPRLTFVDNCGNMCARKQSSETTQTHPTPTTLCLIKFNKDLLTNVNTYSIHTKMSLFTAI